MMDFNALAPFAIPLAALFGLLVGSFLNVVIYRVPVMMERGWTAFAKEHLGQPLSAEEQQPFNLIKPDSRCPQCQAPVRAWQNIPVISYLLLGGKCASCRTPISKRYPLVELLTAALFALVAWQYGWSIITLGGLLFTAMLIALTFIVPTPNTCPIKSPCRWFGWVCCLTSTALLCRFLLPCLVPWAAT